MEKLNNRLIKILDLALNDGASFQPPSTSNTKFISELEDSCYELFSRDFHCQILDNSHGQLCSTYPSRIIIPLSQRAGFTFTDPGGGNQSESLIDVMKLNEVIMKSKYARTRCRFPVPSITIDGKFVCRSSTLARSPEIYARMGYSWTYSYFIQGDPTAISNGESNNDILLDNNSLYKSTPSLAENNENKLLNNDLTSNNHTTVMNSNSLSNLSGLGATEFNGEYNTTNGKKEKEWVIDKMRNLDVDLLNLLNVDVICDFMVENKKVKFGLNVTSSEKVDTQQRYLNFQLLSVPYPGCEFFAEYQKCNYKGEGLKFDWKQTFVDAQLNIPSEIETALDIHWTDYVNWDLVKLTQNYLALILDSLSKPESSGILLHCISGWDRTPLFVSIVRLSLWADGLIHESLSAEEIVFFTVAYDWLLFSHQFSDRIDRGEEIMYFCFDFLSYITSTEFSLIKLAKAKQIPEEQNTLSESIFMLDSFYSTQTGWKQTSYTNGHCNGTSNSTTSNPENEKNLLLVEAVNGDIHSSNGDLTENKSAIFHSHNQDLSENSDADAAILFVKDNSHDQPNLSDLQHHNSDEKPYPISLQNNSVKLPLSYSNSAPASPKCNTNISFEKSCPIPISKMRNKRLRSGSLNGGSVSDGEPSCNEPGSWQMVSFAANFPNSSSHESDDAIKLPSELCKKSINSSVYKSTAFTENATSKPSQISNFDELYQRRKDRLLEAQSIFLPAYKQSLKEQSCRKQQSGAIGNLFNTLRSKLSA